MCGDGETGPSCRLQALVGPCERKKPKEARALRGGGFRSPRVAEGGFVSRACMLELPMHAIVVFCFLSCCFCVSEALPYSSTMTTWAGSWWPQVSGPPNVEGKELEGRHESAAENQEGKESTETATDSDRTEGTRTLFSFAW